MKGSFICQVSNFRYVGRNFLFVITFLLLPINCFMSSAFADDISSKAAIVIDSESERILFAKNPNLRLPPASTTKLVTAMVVLDRINPETVVSISRIASEVPSVSPHIKEGERYRIKDLLYLALMRSNNGATVALAEAVSGTESAFVKLMNERVERIGAENTRFANASGLPGGEQYTTAFDLAKIMKESLKYPLIRDSLSTREKEIQSVEGREIFLKNTNQLLWTDNNVIGGKTGYTRAAQHCFVCATKKDESTLITVILGQPVRDNLWTDSIYLLSRGKEVVDKKLEPIIYLSNISKKKPIILASYKSGKKHKIAKAKNIKKIKKVKVKTVKVQKKSKIASKQKNKSNNIKVTKKSGTNRTKNVS